MVSRPPPQLYAICIVIVNVLFIAGRQWQRVPILLEGGLAPEGAAGVDCEAVLTPGP